MIGMHIRPTVVSVRGRTKKKKFAAYLVDFSKILKFDHTHTRQIQCKYKT
jgi:hypothetical protein